MSIHPIMQKLAAKLERTDHPAFGPGDTIRVQVKIREGEKERLQAFEGMVIATNKGPQGTFTVRKMSFGQGVERIFPYNSKVVDKDREAALLRGPPLQALLPARPARQGCPPARSRPRLLIFSASGPACGRFPPINHNGHDGPPSWPSLRCSMLYCAGRSAAVSEFGPALGVAFAAVVGTAAVWMGTHGCSGAFCPGNTAGPARRIIPAGHGASSSVGLTSTGSSGACTGPFAATLCFDPGHA